MFWFLFVFKKNSNKVLCSVYFKYIHKNNIFLTKLFSMTKITENSCVAYNFVSSLSNQSNLYFLNLSILSLSINALNYLFKKQAKK